MPSLPAKMKILLLLAKAIEKQTLNSSRSGLFHMKTRVSLKYLVNDCIDITQNLTAELSRRAGSLTKSLLNKNRS